MADFNARSRAGSGTARRSASRQLPADRMRELSAMFTRRNVGRRCEELLTDRGKPVFAFSRSGVTRSMTAYDPALELAGRVPEGGRAGVVRRGHRRAPGLKQLRCAETEKYAHVTCFFNGGREAPFPGEDRKLVPSPRDVADLRPEARDERARGRRQGRRGHQERQVRLHPRELREPRHGRAHRRPRGRDPAPWRRSTWLGARRRRRPRAPAARCSSPPSTATASR